MTVRGGAQRAGTSHRRGHNRNSRSHSKSDLAQGAPATAHTDHCIGAANDESIAQLPSPVGSATVRKCLPSCRRAAGSSPRSAPFVVRTFRRGGHHATRPAGEQDAPASAIRRPTSRGVRQVFGRRIGIGTDDRYVAGSLEAGHGSPCRFDHGRGCAGTSLLSLSRLPPGVVDRDASTEAALRHRGRSSSREQGRRSRGQQEHDATHNSFHPVGVDHGLLLLTGDGLSLRQRNGITGKLPVRWRRRCAGFGDSAAWDTSPPEASSSAVSETGTSEDHRRHDCHASSVAPNSCPPTEGQGLPSPPLDAGFAMAW